MPTIKIPNTAKRDFGGIGGHLSNFGRWGTHPKKRFIVANWSWHTVVRIYAQDASIMVSASPQFVFLFFFGLFPIFFLAMGLIGLPEFGRGEFAHGSGIFAPLIAVVSGVGLEMAVGIGVGWLLWRVLLASDVLERMAKLLVAPAPMQPQAIPAPLIQRIHLQRAHLVVIVLCIFLEKFLWAPERHGETDYRFSFEGTAWLSRQFGELVAASLLGIVEASVLMWIFMAGLLLIRTFKKMYSGSEVGHATASGSIIPAELRRDRRAA